MNDLRDSLTIKDDKFALIAEMNKMVDVIVKTPVGDAEMFSINKIEQQGTVLALLKCANQMDSVAREFSSEAVEMFTYRKVISIPPMGMIDDLVSIAYSGFHSVLINATIDAKLSLKKLEIHRKKSIKFHISKDLQSKVKRSSKLKVQGFDMVESKEETYIGHH